MKDNGRDVKTVVPRQGRSQLPTVWVSMCCLVTAFAGLALVMTSQHGLADSLVASIPAPGLASERNLRGHLRIDPPEGAKVRLTDNTEALVAQARVTNDSFMPVGKILVRAEAYRQKRRIASVTSACGKAFSPTLLGRIGRKELAVIMDLPPSGAALAPGASTTCQVVFPRSAGTADEVGIRVASVEPLPGHPPPRFLGPE